MSQLRKPKEYWVVLTSQGLPAEVFLRKGRAKEVAKKYDIYCSESAPHHIVKVREVPSRRKL